MQADKRWDEECGRYTLGSRASTASLEGKTAGTGCLQSPRVTLRFAHVGFLVQCALRTHGARCKSTIDAQPLVQRLALRHALQTRA
jgi:hypothetical protein